MRQRQNGDTMCRAHVTKRKGVFIAVVIASLIGLLFVANHHIENVLKQSQDAEMIMSWGGFREERGLYNFTLVTALLDIGRGAWGSQTRTYNTYLLYMQRVLRLDVNMIIFMDAKGKPIVDWMRRGRESRTRVILMSFQDLPYYKLKGRIQEIMDSPEYKKDNELVDNKLAESQYPEYDILQLSKLYFMNRAATENPFNNSYFMWMDAGYGHGHDIHPHDGIWIPKGLFEHKDQLTILNRSPGVSHYASDVDRLHKMSINILAGLFFAGSGDVFKTLYTMQIEKVNEWMNKGIIDDDQTMYMLLYYQRPSLFNLVEGDWYDVFKLFNAHKSIS